MKKEDLKELLVLLKAESKHWHGLYDLGVEINSDTQDKIQAIFMNTVFNVEQIDMIEWWLYADVEKKIWYEMTKENGWEENMTYFDFYKSGVNITLQQHKYPDHFLAKHDDTLEINLENIDNFIIYIMDIGD